MKRLSVKKLSILSLVLMGASAVTAAILPKDKSASDNYVPVESATTSTAIGLTCEQTDVPAGQDIQTCDISAVTGTTSPSPSVTSSDKAGDTTLI